MICTGDNIRSSVFGWCVVVTMSDLVCFWGVVWCVDVTMSDLVCLCGV